MMLKEKVHMYLIYLKYISIYDDIFIFILIASKKCSFCNVKSWKYANYWKIIKIYNTFLYELKNIFSKFNYFILIIN